MKVKTDMLKMPMLMRIAEMERERYQSTGDYSATSLIAPPRITRLKKRYASKVPIDPTSMISSMLGTAVHEYVEKNLIQWINRYNYEDYVLEQEMHTERKGRRISGRFDVRDGEHLYDVKTIKTWKLIFDPNFEEFHEQQNIYAWLLWLDGTPVKTINITAFYKDWLESAALRDRSYPQSQVCEYQLDLWDYDLTEQYVDERLDMHIACEEMPDEELPICSRKERWERHQGGETIHYGIMKNRKVKRATRVVKGGNLDDAITFAHGLKGMTTDSVIEIRYAQPKRCVSYCDMNGYCNWYQEWCIKNKEGKVNEYIKFKV